jgi:hypothetical protein
MTSSRMVSLAVGAGLLALSLLVLLVHLLGVERATPRKVLNKYVQSAAAGDLVATDEYAPTGKIDLEVTLLGEAFHYATGEAFSAAMVQGAVRAREAGVALEEAQKEGATAYQELPRDERPPWAERQAWIDNHAWEALSDEDRELISRAEDGSFQTLWDEIRVVGFNTTEWGRLNWRQRREQIAIDTLARYGPQHLPSDRRILLVKTGRALISADQQQIISGLEYRDWTERRSFVDEHGRRLLVQAYQDFYAVGKLSAVEVNRDGPEGMLYKPGDVEIVGTADGGQVLVRGHQVDGAWQLFMVNDLDLDALQSVIRVTGGRG